MYTNSKLQFLLVFPAVLLSLLLGLSFGTHAQARGEWYVETRIRAAPAARVDRGLYNSSSFAVIFEYERNCDPIFSMFKFHGSELGSIVRREGFSQNRVFLEINGVRYSWSGAVAHYSQGVEIAVGIAQDAWNALINNPRSVVFLESDGRASEVPLFGLSTTVRRAAALCLAGRK